MNLEPTLGFHDFSDVVAFNEIRNESGLNTIVFLTHQDGRRSGPITLTPDQFQELQQEVSRRAIFGSRERANYSTPFHEGAPLPENPSFGSLRINAEGTVVPPPGELRLETYAPEVQVSDHSPNSPLTGTAQARAQETALSDAIFAVQGIQDLIRKYIHEYEPDGYELAQLRGLQWSVSILSEDLQALLNGSQAPSKTLVAEAWGAIKVFLRSAKDINGLISLVERLTELQEIFQ